MGVRHDFFYSSLGLLFNCCPHSDYNFSPSLFWVYTFVGAERCQVFLNKRKCCIARFL